MSDVLELSKLQAGRTVLEKSDFPLGALAEEALAMVRAAAGAKKMALVVGIEPGGLAIHADRRRLKPILVNLLANAVKFTPEGGEVRLEAVADPDRDGEGKALEAARQPGQAPRRQRFDDDF